MVFVICGSMGAERVKKRSQVKNALSILKAPHELCYFLTEKIISAIAIHEGNVVSSLIIQEGKSSTMKMDKLMKQAKK